MTRSLYKFLTVIATECGLHDGGAAKHGDFSVISLYQEVGHMLRWIADLRSRGIAVDIYRVNVGGSSDTITLQLADPEFKIRLANALEIAKIR